MPERAGKLRKIVAQLRKYRGAPEPPPSDDPFELILWEQVAYLVDDQRRVEAFERLAMQVGLTPEKILAADHDALQAITRHGGSIASVERAERLRDSARRVKEEWAGDLSQVLRQPFAKALGQAPQVIR